MGLSKALALALLMFLPPSLAAAQGTASALPKVSSTSPDQAEVQPPHASYADIPSGEAASNLFGLPVRSIEFRGFSDDEKVMQNLRTLVQQQKEHPLEKDHVQSSIRDLFATGRFAAIRVEGERTSDNGVALVIEAKQNYFIGPVYVKGNPKRPNSNQLVNASKLQLGELYTPEKLQRAIGNIKQVLSENGYYRAEVQHREDFQANQQVSISLVVIPNQAAKVGKLIVQGAPGFSVGQVEDIAHMHTGDTVSFNRTTKAVQNLRKKYQKQHRLEAQVSIVGRDYHTNSNTVDYTFKIERGPTVDVKVEGTKISKGVLKKNVPVYEEHAVDDDLLNEGRRNLRDYLQTKGYFDAKVGFDRKYNPQDDRLQVIYSIERGDENKLVAIKVEGNRYFDYQTIRERMGIRPASGLMTNGLFSQSQLSRDILSVENLYKANGFLGVQVKASVEPNYQGHRNDIAVIVEINEGPQTRVGSVQINGNQAVSDQQIRMLLSTQEGQPFSDANLTTDRESVVSYYYNNGFPNIRFESSAQPAKDQSNRMVVTYTIKEGEQVFVDHVLLSGLQFTRHRVARKELQIRSGNPLSQIGILDSQRRLYDLGIFNEVDTAIQNPEGDAKYKNVLFDMREARRWTFNYGFGLEVQTGSQPLGSDQINTSPAPGVDVPPNTIPPQSGQINTANPQGGTGISPRVSFEVTRLNFRGRDHTLTFKTHLGQLSRRALVSYDAPRWFDIENLRMTFTIFGDNSRDVRTFSSERLEGSVQAQQTVSKATTLLYRFQYRLVKVDPQSLVISPELVPLLSKPVRVGIPSFTYIRDKRDDPIETHNGNYTTFDTGVASSVFGSAADFGKFLIQNSTYTPFWKKNPSFGAGKREFVLARSTRIGVEEPFGTGDQAIIPLPERFYAGGSQSHRGFALNQAGPRDLITGFPLGGNAIFLNQVELRIPAYPLPFVGDNLNFVFFHDVGNVFDSGQDMVRALGRWYQPHREDCSKPDATLHDKCGFNYMSQALGIGARYRTPLGPVRLDFSYNFNPPSFPFFVQCPSTVPSDGPCASLPASSLLFQSGTLRHFNFFFSIGQSF